MRATPLSLRLWGMRASSLGAVATIFGLLGHLQAGGTSPGIGPVLAVWLVTSVVSAGFLGRRVGWVRIAVLLLAEQVLVHVSLMWLVGMGAQQMPSMPGMAGMADMPGMSAAPAMQHMSVLPSAGMLIAHGLAAAVAGLWLWRGECALWSLLALAATTLRRWLPTRVLAPALPHPATNLRMGAKTLPSWGTRIARTRPRRGPPALCAL